jgi:hypothetical protein
VIVLKYYQETKNWEDKMMVKARSKFLFYVEVMAVIASLFLTGSSFAAPKRMYTGPELPASQTALVRGADITINLVSCDGAKVTSLEVSVLPGEHTIEMSFSGGGSYSSDTAFLKFTAEAGHTYVVDKDNQTEPGKYFPFILDKTTGKKVSQNFTPSSKLEERLTVVEKWIKEHPQNANYWAQKGNLLNRLKRYSEALSALETAVSLKSDDGAMWNEKSLALYQLGRHEEALADIEKAIQLRGNDNDRR